MKRVIYYLTENYNEYELKIYNSFISHIHLGLFTFNNNQIYLNDVSPYDNNNDNLWFDLGIATEKNITCLIQLNMTNFFDNYNDNYKLLCELINNKKLIIKGIDIDIENKASLSDTIKFITDIKKDFPNLLLAMSVIGYSMCVKDVDTKYEDIKEWSYSVFNKLKVETYIDYYNCSFDEDDFTMDSFEDMIINGFKESKLVMGSISKNFNRYDNYFELNRIKKKYNLGGTFIKYFHNAPYKWDISSWLSINSK
jgi:hypothetical protein